MPKIIQAGDGVIFMKVGTHAAEALDHILERKRREIEEAGVSFWGYGGQTLHPTHAVQPFVNAIESNGNTIFLVMQKMDSRHFAEPTSARQYSDDGVTWNDVPKGVNVTGSRYALTIESLEAHEEDLDFDALEVGIGKCAGRAARDYVKGRVDKGCFNVTKRSEGAAKIGTPLHIDLVATLKAPYAVLLR